MPTTIQNLHSLTAGNQPGDLMPGEIAYNLADGFVYLGNGSNAYTDTLGQQIGTPTQDGMGWQQAIFNAAPIPGAVTLAGTYDAQTNEVTSVTAAGLAAGFTENAALPASAAGNADYYVIVQIGGTLTPPAPTGDADPGDWIVSTGNGWALVQNSNVTVPATNVTINPTGDFTGPTMQDVLNQIQLLYVTMADGAMSQLNCNGDATVFGNTTLGDADTDTLTVNATSAFAAPVAMSGTCQVTGALSSTSGIYSAGTLRADGNVDFRGNCEFGTDATDTVAVAGPATLGNNLTVAGVTQLNGASQINGPLTTSNTVALTGAGGVTLSTPLSTTGNITITIGGSASLGINSTDVDFYGGSVTNWRGQLNLTQGSGTATVNYTRPTTTGGTPAQGNLNNFLVVPGTIIAFGGTTAPEGYLACDGAYVSKTQYPDLYAAIGDTWPPLPPGNNFRLPDLRGLFLRGAGTNNSVKRSDGAFAQGGNVGRTASDTLAAHTHTYNDNRASGYGLTSTGNSAERTSNTGSTGGAETAPVQATVLYCIKF